jgi:zinc protease
VSQNLLVRFAVLIAALASSVALAPCRAGIVEVGDGRSFLNDVLDNGLEVSILADPGVELVATQVWYHVGSGHEDEGSRGLAHLFEHLMFGPTATHEKDAVFKLHTRLGGRNNAYTSFDETVYVSEIAPPHHLEVLSLEAARMSGLVLTQEELENEQRIVTEELRVSTENDPFARVMVAALSALLDEHPYALTPVGTKEDIAAATLDSCRAFYERYYRPANAHVVVVGPVDPEETLRAVRERFGSLTGGAVDRPGIPSIPDWSFPEETVLSEDLPPVETAIAFYPVPGADHPDAAALVVLRSMLTGQANPFREDIVRRREKALEAGLEIFWNRRGGAIGFYAAQLPYRRKKTAFRQIGRSLERIAESLDERRLAAARRALLEGDYAARYYVASMADRIGRARWHRGDAADAFAQSERLRAVTLDDVRRVWRVYVEQREPVRLYLKPEHVPILIRLFGWVYPVVS